MSNDECGFRAPRALPVDCFAVLNGVDETGGRLQRIAAAYHLAKPVPLADTAAWDAAFFGLDASQAYHSLSKEARAALLSDCGRAIFDEAMHIETAGMTYTAKMALEADTLDARTLYALFAGDEARHMGLFRSLVGEPSKETRSGEGFLSYLDGAIREEAPRVLVLLVQVLLEGWGIRYYTSLARDARVASVEACFRSIVVDEGHHHGSGLVLFNESALTANETLRLEELVHAFFSMVRMGPLGLVDRLSRAAGGFSRMDVERFLKDVAFENKVAADLKTLAGLLNLAGARSLLSRLEEKGALTVPSRAACRDAIAGAMGCAPC